MCTPDLANTLDSPQVLAALAKVDEVYRAAVALFYLEDYSYREIADVLEVPVGTVKSRIARGILQLRQLLDFDSPKRSLELVRRPFQKNETGFQRPGSNPAAPGS